MTRKIENISEIEVNITVSPYSVFKSNIRTVENVKRSSPVRKSYTSMTESFVSLI